MQRADNSDAAPENWMAKLYPNFACIWPKHGAPSNAPTETAIQATVEPMYTCFTPTNFAAIGVNMAVYKPVVSPSNAQYGA